MPEYLSDDEVFGADGGSNKYLSDEDVFGKPERTALGTIADTGVSLAKGVVGLGSAAVGIADIPTMGYAGKGLEKIGYDAKKTQSFFSDLYSPAQKAANKEVDEATGFVDSAKAYLQNPSTIAQGIVETIPSVLGGGAVARGGLKYAPKLFEAGAGAIKKVAPNTLSKIGTGELAGVLAGATGEGVISAGSTAEQIRGESADGTLSAKQTMASALNAVNTSVGHTTSRSGNVSETWSHGESLGESHNYEHDPEA